MFTSSSSAAIRSRAGESSPAYISCSNASIDAPSRAADYAENTSVATNSLLRGIHSVRCGRLAGTASNSLSPPSWEIRGTRRLIAVARDHRTSCALSPTQQTWSSGRRRGSRRTGLGKRMGGHHLAIHLPQCGRRRLDGCRIVRFDGCLQRLVGSAFGGSFIPVRRGFRSEESGGLLYLSRVKGKQRGVTLHLVLGDQRRGRRGVRGVCAWAIWNSPRPARSTSEYFIFPPWQVGRVCGKRRVPPPGPSLPAPIDGR